MADNKKLGEGDSIEFHYQKPPSYRTIHSDGFWGGSTPRGQFAISFFSERPPLPKSARRAIVGKDGGQFVAGPEIVTESLDGLVRQIETTVMLDLRTTQELYVFLGEHLAQMEPMMGVAEADRVTGKKNGETNE